MATSSWCMGTSLVGGEEVADVVDVKVVIGLEGAAAVGAHVLTGTAHNGDGLGHGLGSDGAHDRELVLAVVEVERDLAHLVHRADVVDGGGVGALADVVAHDLSLGRVPQLVGPNVCEARIGSDTDTLSAGGLGTNRS